EKVIHALDKAKAEVVLDVTIMEVDHNTLQDLGIAPPGDTTLGFTPPRAAANSTSNDVSLKDLGNIGSSNFSLAVNDTVAKFLASHSSARLLQNPRIRTQDGI